MPLQWDALQEFRAALLALPATMTTEAAHDVEAAANGAAVAIRSEYGKHRLTGNLQDHVSVEHRRDGVSAVSTVKSTAKHATIFETGTELRHTSIGANRGRMPPGRVFIPVAIRERRTLTQKLIALVERAGFTVTGTP